MVVFVQNGFILAQVDVFGQSRCIWAKIVVFVQIGCTRTKRLYSDKVVVFGHK